MNKASFESWPLDAGDIDINAALDVFSHPTGNRPAELKALLHEQSNAAEIELVEERFRRTQNALYQLVIQRVEENGLSASELTILVKEYSKDYLANLDDIGRYALTRWLVWMCWHEGLLIDDDAND